MPTGGDVPSPTRGTLVSHAPTTIADAVAHELRIAVDATAQLRTRWIPRLATSALGHRTPAAIVVIRARRALIMIEDAIARTAALDPRARTGAVEQLLAIVTDERAALVPVVTALLGREPAARSEPAPDPVRQRAVTAVFGAPVAA